MKQFIDKLISRLDAEESKILDIQYSKRATSIVVERCDAQLKLIEKIKNDIIQITEEVKGSVKQ